MAGAREGPPENARGIAPVRAGPPGAGEGYKLLRGTEATGLSRKSSHKEVKSTLSHMEFDELK